MERTTTNALNLARLQISQYGARKDGLSRSSTLRAEDEQPKTAVFPCIMLPASRSSRFFERKNELEEITQFFQRKDMPGLRSFAVYGLGGIGKTQIALTYAHCKSEEGYDIVVWVHAETEIALSASLAELALQLRLPQVVEGQNSTNALLALDWLRGTGKPVTIIARPRP
jgi:hypothetical protein